MTNLFSPLTLRGLTLPNRIAVSPMCQYQAEDGLVNEWHSVHYGGLAQGGAGLILTEAAAVAPEAVDAVLAAARAGGFAEAAVVGRMVSGPAGVRVA